MKLLRLPYKDGREAWIVTHQLLLASERFRRFRPIHVFTFLAHLLIKGQHSGDIYTLSHSLENKLVGTRRHRHRLRQSYSAIGETIYSQSYVRDYEDQQEVNNDLEAYLNAIYSSLEIAAQINRLLHPGLPMGFRKQSKKHLPFAFKKWPWLPHFYDLRSELTHFHSALPIIPAKKLIIEFRNSRRLEHFQRGRSEIGFDRIFAYADELFEFLDTWAVDELAKIDRDKEIPIWEEVGIGQPLQGKHVKVRVFLDLLKKNDRAHWFKQTRLKTKSHDYRPFQTRKPSQAIRLHCRCFTGQEAFRRDPPFSVRRPDSQTPSTNSGRRLMCSGKKRRKITRSR